MTEKNATNNQQDGPVRTARQNCGTCRFMKGMDRMGIVCTPPQWMMSGISRIVPKTCRCNHWSLDPEKVGA